MKNFTLEPARAVFVEGNTTWAVPWPLRGVPRVSFAALDDALLSLDSFALCAAASSVVSLQVALPSAIERRVASALQEIEDPVARGALVDVLAAGSLRESLRALREILRRSLPDASAVVFSAQVAQVLSLRGSSIELQRLGGGLELTAVSQILPVLTEPSVRLLHLSSRVLVELGVRGTPAFVPALRELARRGSPWAKQEARDLSQGVDDERRMAVNIAPISQRWGLNIIQNGVRDSADIVAANAAVRLEGWTAPKALERAILRLSESVNPFFRLSAARLMRSLPAERRRRLAARLLSNETDQVVATLLWDRIPEGRGRSLVRLVPIRSGADE